MRATDVETGPTAEPREGAALTHLLEGEQMNVLHLRMEPGSTHGMHSHPNDQVGYVLEGELVIVLEGGEEHVVGPDGAYYLDADEPHGVENRGEVVAKSIEVFSPPRELGYWDA